MSDATDCSDAELIQCQHFPHTWLAQDLLPQGSYLASVSWGAMFRPNVPLTSNKASVSTSSSLTAYLRCCSCAPDMRQIAAHSGHNNSPRNLFVCLLKASHPRDVCIVAKTCARNMYQYAVWSMLVCEMRVCVKWICVKWVQAKLVCWRFVYLEMSV